MNKAFLRKIIDKTASIAVVGLGYVGLPLAIRFVQKGFVVTGYDIDKARVTKIRQGHSFTNEVLAKDLKELQKKKHFSATTDPRVLADADVVLICVQTPLTAKGKPDVKPLIAAAKEIEKQQKKKQLVVLLSTSFPGTTREVILPQLEQHGKRVGKNFYLAFVPERIDTGNTSYTIEKIPLLVGGIDKQTTDTVVTLFKHWVNQVIPVSSPEVAEMAKILENSFRFINISFINEINQLCNKLAINTWEVIDLASTKPFGFLPHYPSIGVGGECIPIDPLYFNWKIKQHGEHSRFIQLAQAINDKMPHFVIEKLKTMLRQKGLPLSRSYIILLGITYKKDVPSLKQSSALKLLLHLQKQVEKIAYCDPYCPSLQTGNNHFTSLPLAYEQFALADCVVIATPHTIFDFEKLQSFAKYILDTTGIYRNRMSENVTLL